MPALRRHPCFHADIRETCGRVHLPVAPSCNILCIYCNRKYDCLNESRPGVTSAVLKPHQAVPYLEEVVAREPRITVVGLAGPGDPLATPRETLETLRRVRERFPHLLLCLATNGLGLPPYIPALAELGVSHVSVTINAAEPEVAARLYCWVREGKKLYRGKEAGALMLTRQQEAVAGLKAQGVAVKVNMVVVPGVNEDQVPQVARQMAALGVDILNLMPVYPTPGTPCEGLPEPTAARMAALRAEAARHLPQMHHCTRCRADAVGLLGEDRSQTFRSLMEACARLPKATAAEKPYVAVATREGMLVNLHLGEASSLQIWGPGGHGDYVLQEERPAPPPGTPQRWAKLADILKDCRALLVHAAGEAPREVLREYGIQVFEVEGFILPALAAIYEGEEMERLRPRRGIKACAAAGGRGLGCG